MRKIGLVILWYWLISVESFLAMALVDFYNIFGVSRESMILIFNPDRNVEFIAWFMFIPTFIMLMLITNPLINYVYKR